MRWRFTLNPDDENLEISEPIGWAEISLKLVRDKKWHGIFFEYALPFGFYNDPQDTTKAAADFITDYYNTSGLDAMVFLQVELACGDTDTYEDQGVWRLSFKTYERIYDDGLCIVNISLEPEDCLMTFRNRYDQAVDLDNTLTFGNVQVGSYTALPESLEIPAVTVLQIATLNSPAGGSLEVFNDITQEDTVASGTGTRLHDVIAYAQFGMAPGKGVALTEPNNLDEITSRNNLSNEMFDSYVDMSPVYVVDYDGEYTIVVTVQGRSEVIVETNANNTDCGGDKDKFNYMKVEAWLEAGGTSILLHSSDSTGCYTDLVFTSIPVFMASNTFTLSAGDEIRLYVRIEGSGEWNRDLIDSHPLYWTVKFTGSADMEINALTKSTPSSHDVYLINEVGSRILEAITDNCMRMLSNYYGRTNSQPYAAPSGVDGKGSLRAITTGLHLRDYITAKLNLSFKEYFEQCCAIDNTGIGLEDDASRPGFKVMRHEPSEYFYEDVVILQLDKIPKVVIKSMEDYNTSIFEAGYEKSAIEDYYGLDEFNTRRSYRTSLSSVQNTMGQICKWIASGYAIELTRRKQYLTTITKEDWKFDFDKFILCLHKPSGTLAVEQGNIALPANLVDPTTVLNFRISPARNAMRWLKYLLMSYRAPGDASTSNLIYMDGTGNMIAEGLMTGAHVEENAAYAENAELDVDVLSDPANGIPKFVPDLWELEAPLGWAEYLALKANPKGIVQVRYGQQVTYQDFYIKEVDYRPNEGDATFQLLPKAYYPIDECCTYVIQKRSSAGESTVGSPVLIGAAIANLFIFVGENLLGYNDANTANNEIQSGSWDSTTGYATLGGVLPAGKQITILYLPPMTCSPVIKRFEGRGNGTNTITLTGFTGIDLSRIFVYYGKNLLGYNDNNSSNNEITGWNPATAVLTLASPTNANRELRAFAITN